MLSDLIDNGIYEQPRIDLVNYKSLKISRNPKAPKNLELFINDTPFMTYNLETHSQAHDLLINYHIAHGHCICTGLGFMVRETLLLNNPIVDKVTVLENSLDLIELQEVMNPKLMKNKKLEVIHTDANTYKGSCDFLSVDHYEDDGGDFDKLMDTTVTNISNNIKHDMLWFWNIFQHLAYKENKYEIYRTIKQKFNYKLPELEPHQLYEYVALSNQEYI